MNPGSTRPGRRTLAAGLVALLVLAGCSGSDGAEGAGQGASSTTVAGAPADGSTATTGSGTTVGSTTVGSTGPSPAPEQFSGPDADFYAVPDPLPPGRPGDLIRVQDLGEADGRRSLRIMYHSVDAADRDRAVTGIVTFPTAAPPADGWPVVAWAHGTTGMMSDCAPSRQGGPAPAFGIEGVAVATDYIGLGPLGERHAYLSGLSEGHSVIDAVRAAVRLPETGAGTRWVALGHSQGGHAALFTNQLGPTYAPELDLLGTVAIAPAAALFETFGPQDQVVPKVVGIMALFGAETEHEDIDAGDYVSPAVAAGEPAVDAGCMDGIITAFAGIPVEDFYVNDPRETEPARTTLEENDPGRVLSPSPLLVVKGLADTWVVPERVDALMEQLCSIEQVAELVEVPAATHDTVVGESYDQLTAWLQARLDGEPLTDSC